MVSDHPGSGHYYRATLQTPISNDENLSNLNPTGAKHVPEFSNGQVYPNSEIISLDSTSRFNCSDFMNFAKMLDIDSFIDVGANIGAYSIVLSSIENVKAVHAFEPSPKTLEELHKNIQLNESARQKVTVYNKAVSNSTGEATFGIIGDYSGANSITETSIHDAAKVINRIAVDLIALDEFLPLRSKRVGLKIDVEGHEQEVLGGAKNLLCNNKVILQLEYYSDGKRGIRDLLETYGYERILGIGPDNYLRKRS